MLAEFNYCTDCGTALGPHIVAGQARNHAWCSSCKEPRYQHPMIVVTCFVSCGQKLLWVQRDLEPKRGLWAIPGGYMEAAETLAQGAARELREEAGVDIDPARLELYMTGAITFINQLYVAFRATVDTEYFEAGVESQQCAFYSRDDCPWEQLAYPEVNDCIEQAYDDLESGDFKVWQAEMVPGRYQLWPVSRSPSI
jgi:8-oxo-dGTP diphosphatase